MMRYEHDFKMHVDALKKENKKYLNERVKNVNF